MKANIESAIKWLSESNIRNRDKDKISFGSINNGYDWRNKEYPYVYSEITGYAIKSFLNIYKWTGEEMYLQYAKEAADYLIRLQSKAVDRAENGAIPHSLTLPDLKVVKKYWSFDNAVIVHGIADLYTISKEKRYYDACLKIANCFLENMQNRDGSFLAFYDAEKKTKYHDWKEFHGDNGCLHVKNVLGILKLAEISSNKKYYDAARKVCDWGLRLQDNDGIFWVNSKNRYVFTHAHCYATEGYLYSYSVMGDRKYLETSIKSADGLVKLQNSDGSLYKFYKDKISMKSKIRQKLCPTKATDATAQAVRIWVILNGITEDRRYLDSAKKAIGFLTNMQCLESDDDNMTGGFYSYCDNKFGIKRQSKMMFTWSTQFALSAFCCFDHFKNKRGYQEIMTELF